MSVTRRQKIAMTATANNPPGTTRLRLADKKSVRKTPSSGVDLTETTAVGDDTSTVAKQLQPGPRRTPERKQHTSSRARGRNLWSHQYDRDHVHTETSNYRILSPKPTLFKSSTIAQSYCSELANIRNRNPLITLIDQRRKRKTSR